MSARDELAAVLLSVGDPEPQQIAVWERGVCELQADVILASDWLAARDADLRERIAQAIEAGCHHPLGPIGKKGGFLSCVRCSQAARIARTTGVDQ